VCQSLLPLILEDENLKREVLKYLKKWANNHPLIEGKVSDFCIPYENLNEDKKLTIVDMKEALSQGKGALNFVTLFTPEDSKLLIQVKEQLELAHNELNIAIEQNKDDSDLDKAKEMIKKIEIAKGFVCKAIDGDTGAWEQAVNASKDISTQLIKLEIEEDKEEDLKQDNVEEEFNEVNEEILEGEFSEQKNVPSETFNKVKSSVDIEHTMNKASLQDPLNKTIIHKPTETIIPTKVPLSRRVIPLIRIGRKEITTLLR